jgi:hypothetical protein
MELHASLPKDNEEDYQDTWRVTKQKGRNEHEHGDNTG